MTHHCWRLKKTASNEAVLPLKVMIDDRPKLVNLNGLQRTPNACCLFVGPNCALSNIYPTAALYVQGLQFTFGIMQGWPICVFI